VEDDGMSTSALLQQVSLVMNNTTTNANVYSPLSSWRGYCERSCGSFWWMQTKHQLAANPRTKSTNMGCESTCRLPLCM